MTTTEALRLQLDIPQKEKQELEVRNLKLSDNSSTVTLEEVEKETTGKMSMREWQ